MKSPFMCSLIVVVSALSSNALGQGSCHNSGGGYPGGGYDGGYPNGNGGGYDQPFPAAIPVANPVLADRLPASTVPARPAAKITVVSADAPIASTTSGKPTAKLTIVTGESPVSPKSPVVQVADVEPETIDAKILGLVGTWKAVARRNGGELTTVELRLDDRGWAELTVPDADGRPSATKRRVKLEGEELKLASGDNVMSLGKLVDFNRRQLVLERPEGQMTFVRI